MGKYISLIVIFGIDIFFATSVLLGYKYEGKESSNSYIIYNIALLILGMGLFYYNSIISRAKYTRDQFIMLMLPFLITFLYLFSVLFSNINDVGTTHFLYFILWGVPSIYMGIYLCKNNGIEYMGKYIEVIMLIFSVALIITTLDTLTFGTRTNIGGATYQKASYISAFAFGINLYFIFYGQNHIRFQFTKTTLYKIISYILLFSQLIGVLSSGGRGGMVLVIAYFIYISLSITYKSKTNQFLKYMFFLITTVILGVYLLPKFLEIEIFNSSINRVFAYLSTDGVDWEGTSGRDSIYREAIQLIKDSPVLGYGVFGLWKTFGDLPHNLFLEVLLQGGIVYLSFIIVILITVFKRLFNMINEEPKLRIISIIGLYPLIMLMFSGTYMNNSIFWFCISFIISYKIKCKNQKELTIL